MERDESAVLRQVELFAGVAAGVLIAAAALLQPAVREAGVVGFLLFRIGLPVLGAYLHAARNQALGLWLLWIRIVPWLLLLVLLAVLTAQRVIEPSPHPMSSISPESDSPTAVTVLDAAGEVAAVVTAVTGTLRHVRRRQALPQP